ncbi:NAD(P)-binding protein [Apiospora arundinis]
MTKGTVFITGATGFLGSAFLLEALRKGYSAHVVARSQSKVELVQKLVTDHVFSNDERCKYFIVPDLTVAGAMDEAMKGATHVLHCASPLPFAEIPPERQQAEMIDPAVACTLGVFESAKGAGGATVRRIVVLASLAAFASVDAMGPTWAPAEGDVFEGSERSINDWISPPFPTVTVCYCAAKTAALRSSLDWMSKERDSGLGFDLVNLAPAYVIGHHPLAQTTADLMATSNSILLRTVAGRASDPACGFLTVPGGTHLDDLVGICMESLDTDGKVKTPTEGADKGISNFTIGIHSDWNDAKRIVAAKWPKQVESGLVPNAGDFPSKPRIAFDSRKAESTFGVKLKGLEEMVDAIMPQYIDLLQKETTKS